MKMSSGVEFELEEALSLERFSRYLDWAGGDHRQALELYTLNTRLSEALYTPLQMMEVTLRNRIHRVMTDAFHDEWFRDSGFLQTSIQNAQLAKAIADIEKERKAVTSGRIVAALTFSFWTAMLSPTYETLWQKRLHRIGRRPNGKGLRRKDFAGPLSGIRTIRNRIAHHEPILSWPLPAQHEKIVELTGWLSPAAAEWCRTHSRFPEVYPADGITLIR